VPPGRHSCSHAGRRLLPRRCQTALACTSRSGRVGADHGTLLSPDSITNGLAISACDDLLYDFKGTPSARQTDRPMTEFERGKNARALRDSASWRGTIASAKRERPAQRRLRGGRPAAPCRAGALGARRRHQVGTSAPAGRQFPQQRAPGAPRPRENWPGRPPRAGYSLAGTQITVKGAPKGTSPLRGADPGL
jgi:hypothetical protein